MADDGRHRCREDERMWGLKSKEGRIKEKLENGQNVNLRSTEQRRR